LAQAVASSLRANCPVRRVRASSVRSAHLRRNWRIGRQIAQHCAHAFYRVAYSVDLVCRNVIHNDDVPAFEGRHQTLLDISKKASPFIAPLIIIGALIRSQRSAATNVNVFQAANGTRPITRSPLGPRPQGRVMFVFTDVSSMKTRRDESSSPCSRIQRLRARPTSVRSCSLVCRTFFECDAMALQKAKQRRAASRNPTLHRRDNLVERPVALVLDQGDNLLGVILQRRPAPATGLGLNRPRLPPRLMPSHRRADADAKAFCCLRSGRSLVHRLSHALASKSDEYGLAIWAPPRRHHAPRLLPSARFGNPDLASTETALNTR
jgi:hypothetical protein